MLYTYDTIKSDIPYRAHPKQPVGVSEGLQNRYIIHMKYVLHDCTVAPGGHTILDHIDFEIKGNEKIAVVGLNGAGKTTLLKLLAGEIVPDRDDKRQGPAIERSGDFTIGVLTQTREEDEDAEELSGGQKTRLALAKLFLEKPDLLLLDEPTNHLDMESVERLEMYIKSYPGAVVAVSHDRYFLDRAADAVYELENGKLTRYGGNYTTYRETRDKGRAAAGRRYRKKQEEIERLTELIEKFKVRPNKAAMARAKRKQLERMKADLGEAPREPAGGFKREIVPEHPGPKILWEADKLECGYDKKRLFTLTMKINRGRKIGIIGRNGCGKSTLLKTIAGLIPPLGGEQTMSEYVSFGYFDQETAAGNSTLSGGEQAKQKLTELIETAPNFLILDEPTNHMDIPSREDIETMLTGYKGTVIFVSHDRYFLSRIADSLLIFDKNGVNFYPFGYDHYLYKKEHEEAGADIVQIMDAQAMALLESYQKVPERERGMLRTLSTRELEKDWKTGLAEDECRRCEDIYAAAYEEACIRALTGDESLSDESLKAACDAWTESLLRWYDVWCENEDQPQI